MFEILIFGNIFYELILISLAYLLINYILKKNTILIDHIGSSKHKREVFSNTQTPLSGGLVFLVFITIYFYKYEFNLIFFLILMYLIGLLSDLNLIKSPKIRLIFQSLLVLICVTFTKLEIISIGIPFLDNLLSNSYINIFFVTFCILILINGYNFLDGINTLVVGNFIICLSSILILSHFNNLFINIELLTTLMIICSVIFCFNLWGKSFLGDSGSYSIGFLISILAINFAYDNFNKISPYFVVVLLWYPAFENLFSIIRRIFEKNSLSNPDSKHLHQLIYFYLCKKINISKKIYINSITGIVINLYLILTIIVASNFFAHTIKLVILTIFNILLYFFIYFKLSKNK